MVFVGLRRGCRREGIACMQGEGTYYLKESRKDVIPAS